MIIVGLTGSIATGKTFVGACFSGLGIPVFDADKEVHKLLEVGGAAVELVRERFPEADEGGKIDRQKLGQIVFNDDRKRMDLERMIHPLVNKEEKSFCLKKQEEGEKIVVLEVPLLFETGKNNKCDYVVVTYVNPKLQKERALKRLGMTEEKYMKINSMQLDGDKKKDKANYVINTEKSEEDVEEEVKKIVEELRRR